MYVWFSAMHTRVDLLLSGKEETQLKKIAAELASEIKRLEKIGNYFDPESELSRLNRTASGESVQVSNDLFQMLALCKHYHNITAGLFDISIHSHLYHSLTFQAVLLNENTQSVRFDEKGIRLDLSGFLKGYALDRIREILGFHSLSNVLLNLGNSSILGLGDHPNGKGWKIQLASKENKSHTLFNECYTTSGNEISERKHILNPRTGLYLEGKKTVSVVTSNGSLGEALSTALCLTEPDEQQEILSRCDSPVTILYNGKIFTSGGM